MDKNIIILYSVFCGLFAALGMFLMLSALLKKVTRWLVFGVVAIVVSVIFGTGCSEVFGIAWAVGAIFGVLLFVIVRLHKDDFEE